MSYTNISRHASPRNIIKNETQDPIRRSLYNKNVKRVQREAKISHSIDTSISLPPGMIEMHVLVQL